MSKANNLTQKRIYKRLVRWYRFEIILRSICFAIGLTLCVSLFYSYYLKSIKSKSETRYGAVNGLELNVMKKPKMILEYNNGNYYDVDSNEAIFSYKKNKEIDNISMKDIKIHSDLGYIESKKLLISDNMNVFHFTENPVLIINLGNHE